MAGIALVVIAVAILTYYIGKHVGGRRRDDRWREVPKTLHEAIKAKCVAATSAPSTELERKAEELVEEVVSRIGPVLAFGGPCAKALKGITEAFKGEPPEDKSKEKDKAKGAQGGKKDDKHGGAHGGDPDDGHGVKCETELEPAAAYVTILGGQTLVLTGHRPGPDTCGPEGEDRECPPVLDRKEYARQLRMAVVEFSDFWSRGDCLNELQRGQKALTKTEPFDKHGHGGRHDAH